MRKNSLSLGHIYSRVVQQGAWLLRGRRDRSLGRFYLGYIFRDFMRNSSGHQASGTLGTYERIMEGRKKAA